MSTTGPFSRRELLSRWFSRKSTAQRASLTAKPERTAVHDSVAIIQGRFCLAYRNSFCSVCSERCPVPGAIQVQNGLPRVVLEACTGCGICQQVCPAPRNAVLILPRKTPGPFLSSKTI